jgi:hypothetical protein
VHAKLWQEERMNEQTLWTSGTAIVVAFFTTVIAQYVFAPSLEARAKRCWGNGRVRDVLDDD